MRAQFAQIVAGAERRAGAADHHDLHGGVAGDRRQFGVQRRISAIDSALRAAGRLSVSHATPSVSRRCRMVSVSRASSGIKDALLASGADNDVTKRRGQ